MRSSSNASFSSRPPLRGTFGEFQGLGSVEPGQGGEEFHDGGVGLQPVKIGKPYRLAHRAACKCCKGGAVARLCPGGLHGRGEVVGG